MTTGKFKIEDILGMKSLSDLSGDIEKLAFIIQLNSDLFNEPILNGLENPLTYKEALNDRLSESPRRTMNEAHEYAKWTINIQSMEAQIEKDLKKLIREYFESKLNEIGR